MTHCHFDHLFDVPPLQRKYGGKIVTSLTGKHLCEASSSAVSPSKILASVPGRRYRFGAATVLVLAADHDLVFGRVPFPGKITASMETPPSRPKDWKLGTPLAYLIEIQGKRIYIESGGRGDLLPRAHDVDLAILGTAVRDSQVRFADAVRTLSPRYILPSHQDDFFIPLKKGFHFAATSNFPKLRATHVSEKLPGELILMDFFHSWNLR